MSAFSLNDATKILEADEESGLTVNECVQQLRASGGIKTAKYDIKRELGSWPKKEGDNEK